MYSRLCQRLSSGYWMAAAVVAGVAASPAEAQYAAGEITTLALEGDATDAGAGSLQSTLEAGYGYATTNVDGDLVIQGMAPDGSTGSVVWWDGIDLTTEMATGDMIADFTVNGPYIENPVTARTAAGTRYVMVLPDSISDPSESGQDGVYIGDFDPATPPEFVEGADSTKTTGNLNDHFDLAWGSPAGSAMVRYDLDPLVDDETDVVRFDLAAEVEGEVIVDPVIGAGTLTDARWPRIMNDRSVVFIANFESGSDVYRKLMRCIPSAPFDAIPAFDCDGGLEQLATASYFSSTGTGDPVGGDVLANFFSYRVSPGTSSVPGRWAALVATDTNAGNPSDDAILSSDGPVAANGDGVDGLTLVSVGGALTGGGNPGSNAVPSINDAGLVAFQAWFTGGASPAGALGVFAGDPAGLTPVAVPGKLTDLGHTITELADGHGPSVDGDGCVTFVAAVDDAGTARTGAFRSCLGDAGDIGIAGGGFRFSKRVRLGVCQSQNGGTCRVPVVVKVKNYGSSDRAVDYAVTSTVPTSPACSGVTAVLPPNGTAQVAGCEIEPDATGTFTVMLETDPVDAVDTDPSNNDGSRLLRVID